MIFKEEEGIIIARKKNINGLIDMKNSLFSLNKSLEIYLKNKQHDF